MRTDSIEQSLRERVRGRVRFGDHDRGLYSTDASIYQVTPIGVVEPLDEDDACESVRVCGEHGVGILPRGGGTSLAGQCVNRAVVIDVSAHLDSIGEPDETGSSVRVGAGVTIGDLNDRVRSRGVFFAPDPSTARQATIGGCVGNNAAGVHSVLYGRTSENVESIGACLWDGTRVEFGPGCDDPIARGISERVCAVVRQHSEQIRARFPKTMRRSAGYQLDVVLDQLESNGWDHRGVNLAPLLCGSEGTLAMTLGATVRLERIPSHKGLGVISYDSVEDAISCVEGLLTLGPSGIELMDDLILGLARENLEYREYVRELPGGDARAVLMVEFFGSSESEIEEKLGAISERSGRGRVGVMTDVGAMERAWKLRKAGEPLLHSIPGDRKPLGFIEDNAIPVDRLGEFVERLRAIVEDEGTIASYYAHASVGVLHVRPLLDLRSAGDERAMHRISERTADLALELGGVVSGEHGDGRARGPFLERTFGPELMGAFREIKRIFDPNGLMNPENIVDPGPIGSISSRTRVRPDSVALTIGGVETGFRYTKEGGFDHAVEMCNGAGVCRQRSIGTMCPSYQGTLDERHSTRGRGERAPSRDFGTDHRGDLGGGSGFHG